MHPLFSVIIPTYNRARFLGAALESVLAQSYKSYEIIVIDDGSTDDTGELLARYTDRIRILRQDRQGPGAARNAGIEHANGKYITFLDSDDLWFPWTLACYAQVIQKHGAPSFIVGTQVGFEEETELRAIKETPMQWESFPDYFSTSRKFVWIGIGSVAVCAKKLSEAGGFTNQWVNAEDSDLWMRLGTAEGFVRVTHPPLFGYRLHAMSAMSEFDRTYQGKCFLVEQEKGNQYPGGLLRRRERLAMVTRHARSTSIDCVHYGKVWNGWKLYLRCLRWNLLLRRIRYVCGFPILSLLALFRKARVDDKLHHELKRSPL